MSSSTVDMAYFAKQRYSYDSTDMAQDSSPDIDMSDDESLNDYFDNYVPLSNLPTPPPSSFSQSPHELHLQSTTDSNLLIPAAYLANLIPRSASAIRPSPSTIATYLQNASLPPQTLALTACLLDSLSSSFPRIWRASLTTNTSPRTYTTPPLTPSPSGTFTYPQSLAPTPTSTSTSSTSSSTNTPNTHPPHNLSLTRPRPKSFTSFPPHTPPEVIVLAALKISAGFLEDLRRDLRWWVVHVADGGVREWEVEASVRSILRDVEYDICGVAVTEAVERRRRVMFRGVEESC